MTVERTPDEAETPDATASADAARPESEVLADVETSDAVVSVDAASSGDGKPEAEAGDAGTPPSESVADADADADVATPAEKVPDAVDAATPAERAPEPEAPAATPAERMPEAAASGPSEVPAAPPRPSEPTVTSVSPDIDLAQDASPLPGAHRGGFQRLPTAPVAVTVETAPAEPGGEFDPDAGTWQPEESAFHRGLAGWALAFAIVGLLVSMFVGWGFPIGLVAVASAIIALRRPLENRAVAVWAIVLGTLSILYSAGWLLYAATVSGFLR